MLFKSMNLNIHNLHYNEKLDGYKALHFHRMISEFFVCFVWFCFMSWYFIGALTLKVRKCSYTYFATEETGVEKLKTQDTEKTTCRINNRITKNIASSSNSACCKANVFINESK